MAKVFGLDFAIGRSLLLSVLLVLALPSGALAQAMELGSPPAFPVRPSGALPPQAIVPTAATALSVDINQREAVRNFHNALFLASDNVAMGWTGSVGTCASGVTSPAFRDAVALRINVIRALAGVPAAVTLNDAYNGKAQQAALMMSANNQLSHSPPSSWACYTAEGAAAASQSNLALGRAGADAVAFGYLADSGGNNAAVGHRRWLLYPQTQEMGTGDVAGDDSHDAANALWVQDGHIWDMRPAVRDGFVAWPPPGFVPYPLAFARWSVSYPDADFSLASVSMSRDGVDVPVTLEAVTNGYGENTLVWLPKDALLTDPKPLASTDATFSVSVRNVLFKGQMYGANYAVTLFDPARYGTDTVLPQVVGSAQPASGQGNPYSLSGAVPMADGYDWFYAKAAAYATVLGAENGLAGVTAVTSPGYAVVTNETAAAGANSYHLMHVQAASQTLAVDTRLMPGTNGALNFYSRLGWAGTGETASVQVSLDGGNSWQDIYGQQGSNTQGEQAFTLRHLPLAAFSGRMLQLRFNFKQPTGTYYPSGSGVGWYLDDVAFDDTVALDAPTVNPATTGGTFVFNPPTSGLFALAGRGSLQGHPLEWGGIKVVSASGSSPVECLFNWAEQNYASLFAPAGTPTSTWSVYTYRYYSATNMYLGVSSADNHVYYMGADGKLNDAGSMSYWLPLAGC